MNKNVICDGAGNLGYIVSNGTNLLLVKDEDNLYTMSELIDEQWSGGITEMSSFAGTPTDFQWHDHDFYWASGQWAIDPQPEEWSN